MLKYRLLISASLLLALGARSSSTWAMQEELDGEKPPIASKNSERQRLRDVAQDETVNLRDRIRAAELLPRDNPERSKILLKLWRQ